MIAAGEMRHMAAARGQPLAAVPADIVMGDDFAILGAHNDDRFVEDVVGVKIARIGDFFLAAGKLPDFAPQLVLFGAGIALRNIGLDRQLHGHFLAHRKLGVCYIHGMPFL